MNPYQPPSAEAQAALLGAASPTKAPFVVRPFTSIRQLLGDAWALYFRSFGTIAKITLAVLGPVEVLKQFALGGSTQLEATTTMRVEMAVDAVFGTLVSASLLVALRHEIETGERMSTRAALSAGLKRWGALFGARFAAGIRIGFATLLLVVPGIVFAVRYALTDEVAALDPPSARTVIRRSEELVRGRGWQVLGALSVACLPMFAPIILGGVVLAFADSWIIEAVVDCGTDVLHRFVTVTGLLLYLGLAQLPADQVPASEG